MTVPNVPSFQLGFLMMLLTERNHLFGRMTRFHFNINRIGEGLWTFPGIIPWKTIIPKKYLRISIALVTCRLAVALKYGSCLKRCAYG